MKRATSPLILIGTAAFVLGCAGTKPKTSGNSGSGGSSGGGGGTSTGGGGTSLPPPDPCNGTCTDFPGAPVMEGGAPANAPAIFGAAGSGAASGGPCLLEPQIGALFPNNWLRPRFRMKAAAGQDVFEIRLHAENQGNDLVVYTDNPIWTMPKDMW